MMYAVNEADNDFGHCYGVHLRDYTEQNVIEFKSWCDSVIDGVYTFEPIHQHRPRFHYDWNFWFGDEKDRIMFILRWS